jgi:hypothetical protein
MKLEGKEQVHNLLRAILIRVLGNGHAISIEVDDRVYLRLRASEVMIEMKIDSITIMIPDNGKEVWIVPKKLEAAVHGKSSRRAIKEGNIEPLRE